jgi:NAD(P)-dependent dehydrogenase (short-subunit alcohol dehydrogenase family)
MKMAERKSRLVVSDYEAPTLERTAHDLQQLGATVLAQRTDVSDPDDVDALRDAAITRFGHVDVVFNTVGVGVSASEPVWTAPLDDWRWVMSVNFGGVVNIIRSFVPHMVERNTGHVLNTSSTTAVAPPLANLALYLTSKHAVVGISEALQQDLRAAGSDVRVSVVFPGAVRSRMATAQRNRQPRFGPARLDEAHSVQLQTYLDRQPAGEVVAARILEQMDAGRFYIFGRDEEVALVAERGAGITRGHLPMPPALGDGALPKTSTEWAGVRDHPA